MSCNVSFLVYGNFTCFDVCRAVLLFCIRWKVVDHYVSRVCGIIQLLQQQDIIGRTSELARVFGIQFYHVLTRGSQVSINLF